MAFALELVVALLQSFPFSFQVSRYVIEKSLPLQNTNINNQTVDSVDGQTSDSHRSDCIDSKIINT